MNVVILPVSTRCSLMTKEIIMETEVVERKFSVPKICHECEIEEPTVSENKLLQRRKQLNTDIPNFTNLTLNTNAHGRSCSFRNRPRPKLLNVETDRPRRSSLPSPSANFLSVGFEESGTTTQEKQPLKRVRSFKTTSKGGIVNRGDSFKRSTNSVNSTGSCVLSDKATNGPSSPQIRQRVDSTHSKDSGTAESTNSDNVVYKVAMLGDNGVGKSALTNQFMTSEFVAYDNDQDETGSDKQHVNVLLNSEESTLEIVDRLMDNKELTDECFDAFAVVYSITDRQSYHTAVDNLYNIRHELAIKDKPTILIANKIDLVRKRKVSKEEARSVAKQYDCKYTETSAALNHHVDELLVGILSQIRLTHTPDMQMERPDFEAKSNAKLGKCTLPGPKRLLNFIFRKNHYKESTHECENLFTR